MIEKYDFGVLQVDGKEYHSDVIIYPDSGRVGVRLTGEGYRKSVTMEYWDDQPT